MINHEGKMREKSKITAIILEDIASNPDMEVAAFVSDVETSHTTNNNSDNASRDDSINDLQDELMLDGKLLKLKISIINCDMRDLQRLDDTSISSAPTEANADVSDTDGTMSAEDDFDCINTLEHDSVLN